MANNNNALNPFNIDQFTPEENQYIEASAGTGKTYTIRKISAELVKRGIPLSEVLFVTYTDKAAGEMRDRIREEMSERLDKASAETKPLFEQACQDVDKAVIGTIHSFCRKTLHDFAYEAGVPFDMENIDVQAAQVIIEKKIRDEWESAVSKFGKKNLTAYEKKLLKLFVNALKSYSPDKKPFPLCTSIDIALERVPEAKKHWETLSNNKDCSFTAIERGKEKSFRVGDLIEKISAWSGSGVLFKSMGTSLAEEQDPKIAEALTYFFGMREKPTLPILTQREIEEYNFLIEQTDKLYTFWQQEKARQKRQSYSDMIYAVREAVCPGGKIPKKPTFLCQKLRETYRIAVIDEFQDTNELQWNIFDSVFLKSSQNRLIVVGDPKQSIYSFQGADLQVYRNAIKQIKKGSELDTNYRSSDSMIKACNFLFSAGDDTPFAFLPKGDFRDSKVPTIPQKQRQDAQLNGQRTPPVWLAPIGTDKDFAYFAVRRIIDCCTVSNEKTALRIFEQGCAEPRNVKFSDFAILARSRPELKAIKKALAKAGIPFIQYKDNTLFDSKECTEWLAVLRMLAAPNLTGFNAKLLNSVFVTDFFGTSLFALTDDFKKNADPEAFIKVEKWRQLASKNLWTELQEQIYEDTGIEKALSKPSKLQNLVKLRQIGNYIFGYLYEKKASLQQAIKHLETLAKDNKKGGEEEKNIVAKGTDFKAVKLMTIHSSKGLEFPVVISCAGFTGVNKSASGPYFFNYQDEHYFGFDGDSKTIRQEEETEEWHRLLYVDYTRASSLLILPQFDRWFKTDDNTIPNDDSPINKSGTWNFLAHAHREISHNEDLAKYWKKDKQKDLACFDRVVREAMNFFNQEDIVPDTSNLPDNDTIKQIRKAIKDSALYQHSYSSIDKKSSGIEIQMIDGNLLNPAGEEPEDNLVGSAAQIIDDYPRGNHFGDALHYIFEVLDFKRIGNLDIDSAKQDTELLNLIESSFLAQGLPINKHPDWKERTVEIVWNTMNASFSVIRGNKKIRETFSLKQLEASQRLAEMEFRLNADEGEVLKTFTKGFMDLVFAREDGRYAILDWKSNLLEKYDKEATYKAVQEHYSIQLVLYSYCLIKWLCSILPESTPEKIFEEKFGGIYYVFARGCQKDEESGIYGHTWESFAELQEAYDKIRLLMRSTKKVED